jgi:hypothetical protein
MIVATILVSKYDCSLAIANARRNCSCVLISLRSK